MARTTETTVIADRGTARERTLPILRPRAMAWNVDGAYCGQAIVFCPRGVEFNDLAQTPSIWSAIQSQPGRSLKRHDTVLCEAYDGSWALRATVKYADHETVRLTKIERLDMEPQGDVESEHFIEWRPRGIHTMSGYCVFARSDRIRSIAGPFNTMTQAMAATPKPTRTVRAA